MNKIVLSLFALSFSIGIYAQEYNSEKGHYSKVIQAEGQSIQEINQKVNEWIALTYKSAQDVIQLNSDSKIVMKAIQSIPTQMYGMAYSFYVNNTVTISIREGRFKVDYELGNWTVPKNPNYRMAPNNPNSKMVPEKGPLGPIGPYWSPLAPMGVGCPIGPNLMCPCCQFAIWDIEGEALGLCRGYSENSNTTIQEQI